MKLKKIESTKILKLTKTQSKNIKGGTGRTRSADPNVPR